MGKWYIFATPKHILEKKQSDGSWITVQGGAPNYFYGQSFRVTTPGTYRVKYYIPTLKPSPLCDGGGIQIVDELLHRIGWQGWWQDIPENIFYSNEVGVGPTQPEDINWSFIDPNGNDLFDPSQQVVMNTAGTKNYTAYWLAIFEQGGLNRYWSQGWTNGQIPGDQINLSEKVGFAFGTPTAPFQQIPVSYTVQFAISNTCNTGWTNLDRTFAVCPSGMGCRASVGENIRISPNPAKQSFRLDNLGIADNVYTMTITDLSGRVMKLFNNIDQQEFDITDLNKGLYIINIWNGGQRIFVDKLTIL